MPMNGKPSRAKQDFNARLLATIFLLGVGGYYVFTSNAEDYDALATGNVSISLAFINFALGIGGRARISVFCVGLGLFCVSLLYWLGKVVLEVMTLFE